MDFSGEIGPKWVRFFEAPFGKETAMSTQPSAPATSDSYRPEQEIRFAVVMYGGVSLAIYLHGIAQELLRMVRATAPAGPHPDSPAEAASAKLSARELTSTEKVYRRAGQILFPGRPPGGAAAPEAAGPIRSRFIVDILSGTSAGGINAVYLAKALANDQRLDKLHRTWLDEADIAALLNDERSIEGFHESKSPRTSLLNSQRMYNKLLEAFDDMDEPERSSDYRSPLVDELDLFVTATDLTGLDLPIQLTSRVVWERAHKHVFHFEYSRWSGRNDLLKGYNPMLSFAARATSSFPVAFEPVALAETALPLRRADARGTPPWGRFFERYVLEEQQDRNGGSPWRYPERQFADGGYLDNKPFSYALDAIRFRDAWGPVDRKLFYLEPSPEDEESERRRRKAGSPPRYDFLQNAMLAAHTLPRYETIRADIEALRERNREAEQLQRLTRTLGMARYPLPQEGGVYAQQDLNDMADLFGPAYRSYHRIKVEAATDELARLATRLLRLEPDSDHYRAIRHLIQTWRERHYTALRPKEPGDERRTENRFLLNFDIGYRMRRLDSLRGRIDRVMSLANRLDAAAEGSEQRRRAEEALRAFDLTPQQLGDDFRRALREFRGKVAQVLRKVSLESQRLEDSGELRRKLAACGLKEADLLAILEPHPEEDKLAKAASFYGSQKPSAENSVGEAIEAAASRLSWDLQKVFETASREIREAIESAAAQNKAAGAFVADLYRGFEVYDSYFFPMTAATRTGENDFVEIHRISPHESEELQEAGNKLCGVSLGAFGGFLRLEYRENDIMWGRLDAAEQILQALFPDPLDEPLRRKLTREAWAEILRDNRYAASEERIREALEGILPDADLKTFTGEQLLAQAARALEKPGARRAFQQKLSPHESDSDEEVLDDFTNSYEKPGPPAPEEWLEWLRRSFRIFGDMLVRVESKSPRLSRFGRTLARFGWLTSHTAEFFTPSRDSWRNLFARHFFTLGMLAGALIYAIGLLLADSQFGGSLRTLGLSFFAVFVVLQLALGHLWIRHARGAPPEDETSPIERHPLTRVTKGRRGAVFGASLGAAVLLMIVLSVPLGWPLTTGVSPNKIVSLEFAGTVDGVEEILASWRSSPYRFDAGLEWRSVSRLDVAVWNLWVDFLFIPAYAVALALGCLWTGRLVRRKPWWARAGAWAAWAVLAAGACDIGENLSLLAMIGLGVANPLPALAYGLAALKFALVIGGGLWFLIGLLIIWPAQRIAWPRRLFAKG